MSLRERNGKWHYRFSVDGQEQSGSTGLEATARNKDKAVRMEVKLKERILTGEAESVRVTVQPFNKALEMYLAWAKVEHKESPGTYHDAHSKTAAAGMYFGRQPLHSITSGHIEDFKTWRRSGDEELGIAPVAEVTLRHNLQQIGKFFRYAMKHGWTRTNPIVGVEMPSDADAVRMHVLTVEEESAYFAAAARYPFLHAIGRLMIQQGMRPDEVVKIHKADVDLLGGWLHVRGRVTSSGRRKTKSAAGTRSLPLTQESKHILAQWLVKSPQSIWLFPSPRKPGAPITRTHHPHEQALAAAGVSFVPYDLRHTFATRAAASGCPPTTLAKLLGHKDLKTIMKYVHPGGEDLRAGMALFEAGLVRVVEEGKGATV